MHAWHSSPCLLHRAAPRHPPLQAYAAWPAERLAEIGGSTAFYAQDFLARKEQGEARRARALEAFGSWCPEVGAGGRAVVDGRGFGDIGQLNQPDSGLERATSSMKQPHRHLAPCCGCPLCAAHVAHRCPAACPTQVLSLIEGADALAITEHGQFMRETSACKASSRRIACFQTRQWVAAVLLQRPLASVAAPAPAGLPCSHQLGCLPAALPLIAPARCPAGASPASGTGVGQGPRDAAGRCRPHGHAHAGSGTPCHSAEMCLPCCFNATSAACAHLCVRTYAFGSQCKPVLAACVQGTSQAFEDAVGLGRAIGKR